MFAFNRTPFLLTEGYRAMNEALDHLPHGLGELPPGIHPQREVRVVVNRAKCVGGNTPVNGEGGVIPGPSTAGGRSRGSSRR